MSVSILLSTSATADANSSRSADDINQSRHVDITSDGILLTINHEIRALAFRILAAFAGPFATTLINTFFVSILIVVLVILALVHDKCLLLIIMLGIDIAFVSELGINLIDTPFCRIESLGTTHSTSPQQDRLALPLISETLHFRSPRLDILRAARRHAPAPAAFSDGGAPAQRSITMRLNGRWRKVLVETQCVIVVFE